MGGCQSAASRRRPATPSRRDSLHAGVEGGHTHLSGHVPQPDGGAVASHCQLAGGLLPGCDPAPYTILPVGLHGRVDATATAHVAEYANVPVVRPHHEQRVLTLVHPVHRGHLSLPPFCQ